MKENIKNALLFARELYQLEKKYGIRVDATYEEEVDYDYEGSPFVSGIQSYLIFSDDNGNEFNDAEIEEYEYKLNDLIDQWHESNSDLPLNEYLGFTWEEYLVLLG